MKNLLLRHQGKYLPFFLSLFILFQFTACSYYKVTLTHPKVLPDINEVNAEQKYIVIHSGSEIFSLSDISSSNRMLEGNISNLDREVYYSKERKLRYKQKEKYIIREVHIFLKPEAKVENEGRVKIAFKDIHEVRAIEKNRGKTAAYNILGGIGIIALIVIIPSLVSVLVYLS